METQSKFQQIRSSVSLKLAVIAILTLLLVVPTLFVRNLINERKDRKNETILEVTSKWGGKQTICGPVIQVPYERTEINSENKPITIKGYYHFLPDELSINGSLVPDVRHRGIYKVIVYQSHLEISGFYTKNTFNGMKDRSEKLKWTEAKMVIGITDLRGIKKLEPVLWNGQQAEVVPGTIEKSIAESGFNLPLTIDPQKDGNFKIILSLNGSESINFIPLGKRTNVNIKSAWVSPSFIGSFLPSQSKITNAGFVADWDILQLNRPYPQSWMDSAYNKLIDESSFGIDLIIPVDIYQKTERSVKYALLIIALTFLILFFIEIIGKIRVHPVQYLITGAALVIFYSLLLALSEYIQFLFAYLIAAVTIIGLIGYYIHSIFHNKKYTFLSLLLLAILYTFIYTILSLSNFSLLVGNIGILISLALIMFLSGKVDWYGIRNVGPTEDSKSI